MCAYIDLWGKNEQGSYLDNKVASLTIHKHFNGPIHFWHYFIPHGGETKLISGSKPVNFVEPKTCEEITDGSVFSDDHAGLWDIWKNKKKTKGVEIPVSEPIHLAEEKKFTDVPLVMGSLAEE